MKNRASNIEVKKINRNKVFRYINSHEMTSNPNIASTLGLSTPTVMQLVNELKEQGLVVEVGEYASTGGRKAAAIATKKEKYYAIGLDITQNHIGFVLTDLSGDVIKHKRIQCKYRNEADYYIELAGLVELFLGDYPNDEKQFLGYGISIPGIIDKKNEKIVYSHALKITNVSFSKFKSQLGEACVFVNDANAAAIAEIYHDVIRSDMVYLSLSNSVGGAIIKVKQEEYANQRIENLLYKGSNGRAGEFGHMTLVPIGEVCYCGKVGCADSYISAKCLSDYVQSERIEPFFERLDDNDEIKAVWMSYIKYLAVMINNLRMIFDSPVIIGGYVGSFIEPYLDQLIDEVERRNTFEVDGNYVKPCKYKVEASALGAALWEIDKFIGSI